MVQESLALFDVSTLPMPASALHLVISDQQDAEEKPEPTIGEQMAKVLNDYKNALDSYIKAVARIAQAESATLPCEEYLRAVQVHGDGKQFDLMHKVATRMRERLIRSAERQFAPIGGTLSIDTNDVDQHCPIETPRDRYGDRRKNSKIIFDAAECWKYLEKTYGGAAGEELAYRQIVAAIKSEMFRDNESPVVMRAGRAVISVRIWSERKYNGGYEVSYSSRERVAKIFHNLAAFGVWADCTDMMARCRDAVRHWGYSTPLTSRERYDLGDNSYYVTFLEKWEFHLSKEIADRLQLFIGQFGSDEE